MVAFLQMVFYYISLMLPQPKQHDCFLDYMLNLIREVTYF